MDNVRSFAMLLLVNLCCLLASVTSISIDYKNDIKMDVFMDFTTAYTPHGSKDAKVDMFRLTSFNVDNDTITTDEQMISGKVNDGDDVLTFKFYYISDMLTMDLTYDYDFKFHKFDANKTKISASATKYNLGLKKNSFTSFLCQLPVTLVFNQTDEETEGKLVVSTTISHARIQAFGIKKNDTFGDSVECNSDWTTNIVGNYSIAEEHKKFACVNMSASFSASIPYMVGKKSMTANIMFPEGTLLNPHDCHNDSQPIKLSFYDNQFKLTLTLNRTIATNFKVFVSDIMLEYTEDEVLFPGSTDTKTKTFKRDNKDGLYSYYKGEFFKCLSNETYELVSGDKKIKLYSSHFRYSAYNDGAKVPRLDGKNYEQCPDDVKVSNVVPIAVGAALGVLVLIVLIAYLIGRRKTHKGYESV